WVEIRKAGQTMHELHGPDADTFEHDETGPEAAVRGRANAAEHHDRRRIATVRAQPVAHLAFENVGWHVLEIDASPLRHDRIEVGDAGRDSVDEGPKRLVLTRYGIGIV